jgi:phosphoglucosamine mutase
VKVSPAVAQAIKDAETRLNGHGRILIRKSGTEPVVRVMAEGEDEKLARELVDGLAAALRAAA